jgi:hypothetical protein
MCANRNPLAQPWRKKCAAPIGCTKGSALAQKLRHPLAYRRGLGAEPLEEATLLRLERSMNGDSKSLKIQLAELSEVMADTTQTLARYDQQLAPYWYARGDIEHDVLRTHKRGNMREVVFDLTGAPARVPLFAALDELAREWGPVRIDRAVVKSRLSGYERDYKRLSNELKAITRKEAKNDKGQGSLL